MPILSQPPSMGDALKYELNPNYTRETVTLIEGTQYPAGAVLGRITVSGHYTFASHGGSDGAEVAVGAKAHNPAACGLQQGVDQFTDSQAG